MWLLISAFSSNSSLRWVALAANAVTLPVMWGLTYLHQPSALDLRRWLGLLLWLRQRPALLWLIVLIAVTAYLITWILVMQPAYADVGPFDVWILGLGFWGVSFVLGYEVSPAPNNALPDNKLAGPLISVTTILVMLFAAELGMRMLLVQTDGGGGLLWSMRWFELYWNPINELGYRDYPPVQDGEGHHILLVGDSFAAGHGVKSVDDLMNYELVEMLGPGYSTNIVAQRGWETQQQIDALQQYPFGYDTVLLSYVLNDIHPAALETGVAKPIAYNSTHPALIWSAQRFYVANLVWYFAAVPSGVSTYMETVQASYAHDETWAMHEAELQAFYDHVDERGADLIVVVWPFLTDIPNSQDGIERVTVFFQAHGTPVVNMGDVLASESIAQITASPLDPHPSAYSHNLAAEAVYEVIVSR